MNQGNSAEFSNHLTTLWKRKGLVLGGTAAAVIVAFLVNLNATRIYEASSVVWVVESKIPQPGESQSSGSPSPSAPLKTFIGIIQSKSLAEKTLKALGLDKPPYGLGVSKFLGLITVSEIRGSSLIRIKVRFPDARLATRIANSLANFAVERNNEIFNSDVKSTRAYLKNALENSRSDLEKIHAERTGFRRTSNIEFLQQENKVVLDQMVDLESRYFQVAFHLKKLKRSPARANFLRKKADLAEIQREASLDALEGQKASLLRDRKMLTHALNENETDRAVEQVRLQNLQDQLKNQKKIEVITRSIIDHPGLLSGLKMAGLAPSSNMGKLQFQSEEFNPTYRSTEETLLRTARTIAVLRATDNQLKMRFARVENELPQVLETLVGYKLRLDLILTEYEMAKSEWDRQVAPWKARTIQTGPDDLVEKLTIVGEISEIGTEPITLASKEVLEGVIKLNRERLLEVQSELTGKMARMERLDQNYRLASNLFNLYSKKYGESLLWVASRGNVIKVVDRAYLPVSPVSPKKRFNLIAGLVIGFLFFSFLALSLDYIVKARSRTGSLGNA